MGGEFKNHLQQEAAETDREQKKKELENRLNSALHNCQDHIRALGVKETRERRQYLALQIIREFLNVLYKTPYYRTLVLTLEFSAKYMREWQATETIEGAFKRVPDSKSRGAKGYQFPILTPRLIDWSKSPFSSDDIAHRGSYVREYRIEHPDLETMRTIGGFKDKTTGQQGMIRMDPHVTMGLSDVFEIFPRNITKIELSDQLPDYLDPGQKEAVNEWYKREGR